VHVGAKSRFFIDYARTRRGLELSSLVAVAVSDALVFHSHRARSKAHRGRVDFYSKLFHPVAPCTVHGYCQKLKQPVPTDSGYHIRDLGTRLDA